MNMKQLGMKFRKYDLSAEEIYQEIFPDSLQECGIEFKKGMKYKK